MPRKRRLDRYPGRFQVSNLTDEDDVRILTQECPERRCEGQADIGSHLHLVDATEIVLHGVFGGHDVHFLGVDLHQRRVKRSRLTGTRGAGDQAHAVRIANGFEEAGLRFRFHAELLEVEL